jgi:hypothetical protein
VTGKALKGGRSRARKTARRPRVRKKRKVKAPPNDEVRLADEEKYTYQKSFELEPSEN